ncbi:MAG: YciI family protein [Sphingomonas sp.]
MILVLLRYKVDAAEIDRLRPAHLHWLRQGLADGRLLVAGRKRPPTGGMLLVRGTLDDVRAWCALDPFAAEGVAEYDFAEIEPSMAAPGLGGLLT